MALDKIDPQMVTQAQTWQPVTRVTGTTYTNSTGQPIMLVATADPSSTVAVTIGGVQMHQNGAITVAAGTRAACSYIIPAGTNYVLTTTGAVTCVELR
jgi:hypothetical protein